MKWPRFMHRTHASLMGYFWVPCPLCSEMFGGHEWLPNNTLMLSRSKGQGVCPDCGDSAREQNLKRFPPMEYSKNERAGQLLGFRPSGTAVLEPSELGYRCPVCKNVPLLNHEYDERLTWSEYNSCLWCEVCNRDFPSCLCLEDIGQAIEVFLDSVETAQGGLDGRD